MIENRTSFDMQDVMEYLSGITTKLRDKISVTTVEGMYYDNIVITCYGNV
jgi:hypothetical protein